MSVLHYGKVTFKCGLTFSLEGPPTVALRRFRLHVVNTVFVNATAIFSGMYKVPSEGVMPCATRL